MPKNPHREGFSWRSNISRTPIPAKYPVMTHRSAGELHCCKHFWLKIFDSFLSI